MKKKIIILFSLLVLLIVVFAPAKLIKIFIPENANFTITGLQGSVWSGDAETVEIKQWEFSQLKYNMSLFSLLTGNLGGDIEIKKGDLKGDFSFDIANENDFEFLDANLSLSAINFEKYLPIPGVELNGKISSTNLQLKLSSGQLTDVSGMTQWTKASISLNNQNIKLGNFKINWQTDQKDRSIIGTIVKNQKNDLDIDGKIHINEKGLLEYNGSISASTDKSIYSAFLLFSNGKVASGRLPIKFKKKIF